MFILHSTFPLTKSHTVESWKNVWRTEGDLSEEHQIIVYLSHLSNRVFEKQEYYWNKQFN